jgi:hypothetical protein
MLRQIPIMFDAPHVLESELVSDMGRTIWVMPSRFRNGITQMMRP